MATTARPWQRWLNSAILALGLGIALWGLLWLANGKVSCRGVEMHPGDVCTKSSFTDLSSTETQTYEQRRRSMRQSQPTVIGSGLAVAAFGGWLLWRGGRPPVSSQEERLLAEH